LTKLKNEVAHWLTSLVDLALLWTNSLIKSVLTPEFN